MHQFARRYEHAQCLCSLYSWPFFEHRIFLQQVNAAHLEEYGTDLAIGVPMIKELKLDGNAKRLIDKTAGSRPQSNPQGS
jgi:hypothetical protein